jgi:hypothetical protein
VRRPMRAAVRCDAGAAPRDPARRGGVVEEARTYVLIVCAFTASGAPGFL